MRESVCETSRTECIITSSYLFHTNKLYDLLFFFFFIVLFFYSLIVQIIVFVGFRHVE